MIHAVPVKVVLVRGDTAVAAWQRTEARGRATVSHVPLERLPAGLRAPDARFVLLLEGADALVSLGISGGEVVVGVAESPRAERPAIDWYCQACGRYSHRTIERPADDPPRADMQHDLRCRSGHRMAAIGCCSLCHQDLHHGDNLCEHQGGARPEDPAHRQIRREDLGLDLTIAGWAPVEGGGELLGREVYFRARQSGWRFEVEDLYVREGRYRNAGYMPMEEAERIVLESVVDYLRRRIDGG